MTNVKPYYFDWLNKSLMLHTRPMYELKCHMIKTHILFTDKKKYLEFFHF